VVLGKGTSAICWRITPPTTTGCARTLRSTRIPLSIDLRRPSGVSHQSLGWAVSIATTSDGIIGRHSTREIRPALAPRLSIVVLPFANLSNDPEQQYFADGARRARVIVPEYSSPPEPVPPFRV
jgi:hypothetical protein